MTTLPQVKKGYIRGVKGAVVTGLNSDGTAKDPAATPYGIKTAQQINVSVVSEAGNAATLRGGDGILTYVKDPDTIVAINLTLMNARFDAHAMEEIAGGTLITEPEDTDERVIGWESPSIEDQQDPPHFKLEVYATNYNARGGKDGYIKHTFYYGRATFGNENLQDQNWSIPEMKIECFQNPSTATGGPHKKEFVAELPAQLTS